MEHKVNELVRFTPVPLDEPATSYAMTEDGRYVVCTHQTANLVSFYDVQAERLVATLPSKAPRAVLCRGGRVFVGNYGAGTISVFSPMPQWTQTNQLQVDEPNIMSLSAAGGTNFREELLVLCHPTKIFHLDVRQDRCKEVGRMALATVSYDGKIVMTQESFNQSPSGGLAAYPYVDFIKHSHQAVFAGGELQNGFVYQVHPGGYWLSRNTVYGGTISAVQHEVGNLLVPDYSQKVVYALTPNILRAHLLNVAFTEVGKRKVEFPDRETREFDSVYHFIYRHRNYLLDQPFAYTHGDDLYLFVMNLKDGIVLTAHTSRIVDGPAPLLANQTPNMPLPDGNAGPPANDSPAPQRGAEPSANWAANFPARAAEGQLLRFEFPAAAGVTYQLLEAPSGAKLTPSGTLTWTPNAAQVGANSFKFQRKLNGQSEFDRLSIEAIDRALVEAADGDLSKVDEFASLILDADEFRLRPGADGKSLLLLQGDQLKVLAADGITIARQVVLEERVQDIHERNLDFIGIANTPAALLVFNGETGKKLKHHPLDAGGGRVLSIEDSAINPAKPTTYIAIKHDIELPRYTVLVVNEITGRVEAPGILGKFVAVSPDGRSLYTGYSDLYEKGSHFHLNPDWNVIEIPEYGSIDMLLQWDVQRSKPQAKQALRNAGGNGQGLRLSPDGKRIVYLSHVGFPSHSNNLVGLSADNFDLRPVNYAVKDLATTTEAAFHPVLPWIAMPGPGTVAIFHRETGTRLERKLLLTETGLRDVPIERLVFSPNGKSLVLICKGGESGLYLRTVPLRFTASEQQQLEKGPMTPQPAAKREQVVVPLHELEGLAAAPADMNLTPLEIGRQHMQAVVVVEDGQGFGTGFIISNNGYVLTCAHVVSEIENVRVSYTIPGAEAAKVHKQAATVVTFDDELDIALLKLQITDPLPFVHLHSGKQLLEAGQEITVIGNPGLGAEILKHTMTTGIVSSPDREFEGQHFIQTSAAVNPGNSGGPMFDGHGHVVGMVALKGNIEGTAFAVPASVLREFLEQHRAKDAPR